MKLIKLQCPSCGANLEVNGELKSFTCNFCGTVTLFDDEIIRVEHRIVGTKKAERIEALEALVDDKRYDLAIEKAKKLTEDYPKEARVWLALLKALTNNFTKQYNRSTEMFEDQADSEKFIKTFRKKGLEAAQRERENKLTYDKAFEYYQKYETNEEKLNNVVKLYNAFYLNYTNGKKAYQQKIDKENELKSRKTEREYVILRLAMVLMFLYATINIKKNLLISVIFYALTICIVSSRKESFKIKGIKINSGIIYLLIFFVVCIYIYFFS